MAILESDFSDLLLAEAGKLYYEHNYTQQEIAAFLETSRANVAKMLQTARERGIVQIRVVNPSETFPELKNGILQYFPLRKLEIVPRYFTNAMRSNAMGERAARVLLSFLGPDDTVGLGWGASVYGMVNATQAAPNLGLQPLWVPMIGSLSEADAYFQVNLFTKSMQNKLGGTWKALHVPAMLDSALIIDALMSDARIRQVTDKWSELDIAVFGIGNLSVDRHAKIPSTLLQMLDMQEKDQMSRCKAVGDILSRAFNALGKICDEEFNSRVFGVKMEQLMGTPLRIGVAGGSEKARAIYTAVKYGMVNALVTDESAALKILQWAEEEEKAAAMAAEETKGLVG